MRKLWIDVTAGTFLGSICEVNSLGDGIASILNILVDSSTIVDHELQ